MKIMISGLYGHMGRILYDMIQEKAELFTVSCGVSLDREDILPVPCYQNFAEAENAAVTGELHGRGLRRERESSSRRLSVFPISDR